MGKGGKTRGGGKSRGQSAKQKNYGKKSAYKKPNRYMMVKRQIERNKESEDILKRQQQGKFTTCLVSLIFTSRLIL